MVKRIDSESPAVVADFAVGDGSLLLAAQQRWPRATCLGTDVDLSRAAELLRQNVSFGRCDFTNSLSRRASRLIRSASGLIDVCLLNPPFSSRGATRWPVGLGGKRMTCGRPLAFVVTALSYLRPEGELVAVLPSGTVTAERDRAVWDVLGQLYDWTVVERYPRGVFVGCTSATVVVHFKPGATPNASSSVVAVNLGDQVRLRRGTKQMHVARNGGDLPLVHTTELRGGKVDTSARRVKTASVVVTGPAVLIPRVGKPTKDKVCLVESGSFAISDCVFALETKSVASGRRVRSLLLKSWEQIEGAHGGSCAPFLTARRLIDVLERIGISALWVRRGDEGLRKRG